MRFLDGATPRPDNDTNQRLYNRNITSKEIVLDGKVACVGSERTTPIGELITQISI